MRLKVEVAKVDGGNDMRPRLSWFGWHWLAQFCPVCIWGDGTACLDCAPLPSCCHANTHLHSPHLGTGVTCEEWRLDLHVPMEPWMPGGDPSRMRGDGVCGGAPALWACLLVTSVAMILCAG